MTNRFEDSLVRFMHRDELLMALGSAVDGLLREADEVREVAARMHAELRQLASGVAFVRDCKT